MQYWWIRSGVLACLCAGTIGMTGCDGGRDPSGDMVRNTQDVVITGVIVDGPVVGATIDVISNDGATVSQARGGSTATFSALVPANTAYPITLRVSDGTDLVTGRAPDFALEALISRPDQMVANLSPFSTLVRRIATCADTPIKHDRYLRIWDQVMSEFGMGYDVARFGHPSWTPMQANNGAAFALASEVLGETVRRTRNALASTSATIDDDAVITAVACDFASDQVLDGAGDGASARISATFRAAAAGALVETVTKRLQVGGVDAMSRLDESLRQVLPDAGSVLDIELNPILVRQTRDQLASLLGQMPSDVIARLLRTLDQTSLANLRDVVAAGLTPSDADAFARIADSVAVADDLALKTVLEGAVRAADASQPVIALSASPSDVRAGRGYAAVVGGGAGSNLLGLRRLDRRTGAARHPDHTAFNHPGALRIDVYRDRRNGARGGRSRCCRRDPGGRTACRCERSSRHDRARGKRDLGMDLDRGERMHRRRRLVGCKIAAGKSRGRPPRPNQQLFDYLYRPWR